MPLEVEKIISESINFVLSEDLESASKSVGKFIYDPPILKGFKSAKQEAEQQNLAQDLGHSKVLKDLNKKFSDETSEKIVDSDEKVDDNKIEHIKNTITSHPGIAAAAAAALAAGVGALALRKRLKNTSK